MAGECNRDKIVNRPCFIIKKKKVTFLSRHSFSRHVIIKARKFMAKHFLFSDQTI